MCTRLLEIHLFLFLINTYYVLNTYKLGNKYLPIIKTFGSSWESKPGPLAQQRKLLEDKKEEPISLSGGIISPFLLQLLTLRATSVTLALCRIDSFWILSDRETSSIAPMCIAFCTPSPGEFFYCPPDRTAVPNEFDSLAK